MSVTVSSTTRPLYDDAIKGLMRSIGDAGVAPANTAGFTVLRRLDHIAGNTYATYLRVNDPGDADIFTTTALAAGELFISPTKDFFGSRLSTFGVVAFADVASATDGLKIEGSIDGTNWDVILAKITVAANTGTKLEVTIPCRYTRVTYLNGATAQTVFRLGGRYYI